MFSLFHNCLVIVLSYACSLIHDWILNKDNLSSVHRSKVIVCEKIRRKFKKYNKRKSDKTEERNKEKTDWMTKIINNVWSRQFWNMNPVLNSLLTWLTEKKKFLTTLKKEYYIYLLYIDNIVYIDKTEIKSVKY